MNIISDVPAAAAISRDWLTTTSDIGTRNVLYLEKFNFLFYFSIQDYHQPVFMDKVSYESVGLE